MKPMRFLFLLASIWSMHALQAQEPPYVILVSFDGFRHDYVERYHAPTFKRFISEGAQAEALIPSFPSKTFPNHYTLVTGLAPGNHGLVDNYFYDKATRTRYSMRDTARVRNGYYYGGIPIWQLARQHGIKSASFFWVGSELNDVKRRPDYFYRYDESMDSRVRVQQVLNWLRLPAPERPHLILLYFSSPDHEGHEFGPLAEETKQAVLRADSLLADLMQGLQTIALPVNVILVSDHGMQELTMKEETFIFLDELIDKKDTSVVMVNGGTQTHLYFNRQSKKDSVFSVMQAKEKNFRVIRKEDFPAAWSYRHERAGDLLLTADPGFYFREGSRSHFLARVQMGALFGVHGYDPTQAPNMKGIFYAWGPNIRQGVCLPAIENIHVYPLLAQLLGLPLPPIDGSFERVKRMYKK